MFAGRTTRNISLMRDISYTCSIASNLVSLGIETLYMVPKVIIARASRWATSPATPPLVGKRVKNVWEIDFERLYCSSGATAETEVFRAPCFCSDRAVLTQLVQSCTQQLVTTGRSELYRTLAPRSEKHN